MTTTGTVTVEQIRQLRTEAAIAGDFEQVRLCERAVEDLRVWGDSGRDGPSIAACVRAINAAEAME